MKVRRWILAAVASALGLAPTAAAQEGLMQRFLRPSGDSHHHGGLPSFIRLHPRPPACLEAPIMPSTPKTPTAPESKPPVTPETPTPAQTPTPQTPDFTSAGEYKGSIGHTSSVLAGTGIGGAVSGDPVLTFVFSPLVMPGLMSIAGAQSALPIDRVYFNYGCFDAVSVRGVGTSAPMLSRRPVRVQVPIRDASGIIIGFQNTTINDTGVIQSPDPVAGFNLNSFHLGIEKTAFDGIASAYINLPFLYATENICDQQINGLGDVSAGFKFILYQGLQTGNTLTAGLTISFPTAPAAVSPSYIQSGNGTGTELLRTQETTINPTYIQPWMAGVLVFDRLFVHDYFGIIVPTDSRVATFISNDVTVGYALYRGADRGIVTSVTPTATLQMLFPVTNRGLPEGQGEAMFVPFTSTGQLPPPPSPVDFRFTDQVNVAAGVNVGMGERWFFSANAVVPLTAPRGSSFGGTFSLNYLY